MQRIAVAQLGSNEIDQVAFAQTLAESTIKVIIPMALRSAASVCKDKHKEALLSAATKCEIEGSEGAARAASDAANYAAGAAGAARDAARAASYAAGAPAGPGASPGILLRPGPVSRHRRNRHPAARCSGRRRGSPAG